MKPLYMLRGLKDGNNERYIMRGQVGRPVIQTRTGYRADDILLFDTEGRAEAFREAFIRDRKRHDIEWSIYEYKPGRPSYYSNKEGGVLVGIVDDCPGEVYVDSHGRIKHNKLKKLEVKLDGTWVSFYTRGMTTY